MYGRVADGGASTTVPSAFGGVLARPKYTGKWEVDIKENVRLAPAQVTSYNLDAPPHI